MLASRSLLLQQPRPLLLCLPSRLPSPSPSPTHLPIHPSPPLPIRPFCSSSSSPPSSPSSPSSLLASLASHCSRSNFDEVLNILSSPPPSSSSSPSSPSFSPPHPPSHFSLALSSLASAHPRILKRAKRDPKFSVMVDAATASVLSVLSPPPPSPRILDSALHAHIDTFTVTAIVSSLATIGGYRSQAVSILTALQTDRSEWFLSKAADARHLHLCHSIATLKFSVPPPSPPSPFLSELCERMLLSLDNGEFHDGEFHHHHHDDDGWIGHDAGLAHPASVAKAMWIAQEAAIASPPLHPASSFADLARAVDEQAPLVLSGPPSKAAVVLSALGNLQFPSPRTVLAFDSFFAGEQTKQQDFYSSPAASTAAAVAFAQLGACPSTFTSELLAYEFRPAVNERALLSDITWALALLLPLDAGPHPVFLSLWDRVVEVASRTKADKYTTAEFARLYQTQTLLHAAGFPLPPLPHILNSHMLRRLVPNDKHKSHQGSRSWVPVAVLAELAKLLPSLGYRVSTPEFHDPKEKEQSKQRQRSKLQVAATKMFPFDPAGFLAPDLVDEEAGLAVVFTEEGVAGPWRSAGLTAAKRKALQAAGLQVLQVPVAEYERLGEEKPGNAQEMKIDMLRAQLDRD